MIPAINSTGAKWLLFSLAFTPLVVFYTLLFPFVSSKVFFIRAIVAILLLVLVINLFNAWKSKQKLAVGAWMRNPLFIVLGLYVLSACISTMFGVNPFRSFFGDVERGEGLITILYSLVILVSAIMLFKQRDWVTFFKLSVLTGIIMSINTISEFIATGVRPKGIFLGNPSFVAMYLIFAIFACLVVLIEDKENRVWRIGSSAGILLALTGIFLAQTRGAFLGLIVGLIVVALWASLRKSSLNFKAFSRIINVQLISRAFLILLVLFTIVFVSTRSNTIWQSVPMLDRLAKISDTDRTTQTRIINTVVSINSVNPTNVGIVRSLFGWGMDNFSIAYENFYDPSIQRYEGTWFDRAHNTVMDVLVMNGVLGLIAYLLLWFTILKSIFKNMRGESGEHNNKFVLLGLGALFFVTAYLVQGLFIFDQISMYIPIYMFIGYMGTKFGYDDQRGNDFRDVGKSYLIGTFALASLASVAVVLLVFIPFRQMTLAVTVPKMGDPVLFENRLHDMIYPYNYIQEEVRTRLMSSLGNSLDVERVRNMEIELMGLQREYIDNNQTKPSSVAALGYAYTQLGRQEKNSATLEEGEKVLRRMVEISPRRQEMYYYLANNLILQGKFDEAKSITDAAYRLEPNGLKAELFWLVVFSPMDWTGEDGTLSRLETLFSKEGSFVNPRDLVYLRDSYKNYFHYFIRVKDTIGFRNTLAQAIKMEEVINRTSKWQLEQGFIKEPIKSVIDGLKEGLSLSM